MERAPLCFDIKKYAVHDGPGIRTTLFLKGCPLACKWCQNPESIEIGQLMCYHSHKCVCCGACRAVCPSLGDDFLLPREACDLCGKCATACHTGARHFIGRELSPRQVVDEAAKDILFYQNSGGGLTLSGGECMLYPDYVLQVLQLCKERGIHAVIDTCGHVPWRSFARVLPYTDLFLYDIKKMDNKKHRDYTGVGNALILDNLARLCEAGASVITRIPLIPGYTDSTEDMEAIGQFIVQKLQNRIVRAELLPYNRLAESKYVNSTTYRGGGTGVYPMPELFPQSREQMETLQSILTGMGIKAFAEIA